MSDLHDAIAGRLHGFGGVLRCETCGRTQQVGDIAGHLAGGWPMCHNLTMRWWTQRQIDAGEMVGAVSDELD